jgi:hypothetical protein
MKSSLQPYENSIILPKYKPNLIYFKCYINDILGIWLPTLNWVTKEPSMATNFLDLSIEIHNNKILTSNFYTKTNLYLYLPPKSAHPPSCLKGLITGEIKCYWSQNTPDNFKEILTNFIHRLLQRGHTM